MSSIPEREPSLASSSLQPFDDPLARTLLAAAHAGMYKWPITFAGYRAQLTVNDDGQLYHGHVTLMPQQQPRVELSTNAELQAWVEERLWTQAMHLVDIPFYQGDGRYGLTFAGEDPFASAHPRGVRICLNGSPMESWYRIKDGRYGQIGRTPPRGLRWINTIERYAAAPTGRLYATHYVLAFFAPGSDTLISLESYVNTFVSVEEVLLPATRRVSDITNGAVRTREIHLTHHTLLSTPLNQRGES